jgi:hypothetical protein
MVSSLDNWDGSLSSAAKQNASRITDLVELESAGASTSSTTNTVPDENAVGSGNGWVDMDVNTVCYLFDHICIVAQVAVYLVRRVKFPIA